jgi:hypothetical protein
MNAILTFRNRKALSVSDFISAPAQERAEAFATMAAYAGRYRHTGDKVVHHVEAGAMPNHVGNDLERTIVKLDADHLVLRVTSAYLRGGMMVRSQELARERVRQAGAP